MRDLYTYAVARIRAKELGLLSDSDVGRLMTCQTYDECLSVLKDKGWFSEVKDDLSNDYQALVMSEEKKLWRDVNELVSRKSDLNIIFLPVDYHNLKAAIKLFITDSSPNDYAVFSFGGSLDPEYIFNCIKEDKFSDLPLKMIEPARLAVEKLLHTSDGQLCDVIIDKALLQAMNRVGETSKNALMHKYAEFYVAAADIKIAIRSLMQNKDLSFMKMAMADCETLDIDKLMLSATDSLESLCEYLEFTDYADVVPVIKNSVQNFDVWRDNKIIELLKDEKYDFFSIGPIIAYILARQNEFKVARIILAGKLDKIDDALIKQRLRCMYA